MRQKPIRGQKVKTRDGELVVTLEEVDKWTVKCILANGKITNVLKDDLELPIFETKCFEKLKD